MQGDRYDSLMDVVGYPPPLHPRHRGPAAWSEVVAWTTAGVVTERTAACPITSAQSDLSGDDNGSVGRASMVTCERRRGRLRYSNGFQAVVILGIFGGFRIQKGAALPE